MSLKLMGRKRGMTTVFDDEGYVVPCTVIELQPNVVTQIKTEENDGYQALQTSFEIIEANDPRRKEKRAKKPRIGHFKKSGAEPRRFSTESRMKDKAGFELGQEIGVEYFKDIEYVDVSGISIGKGYQGGMKLHNFGGGKASHGASKSHRSLGSTGCRTDPGRCPKGGKRASHMGSQKKTVQNLKIVNIIEDDNVILVKGCIPGAKNAVVTLSKAIKKRK